MCYKQLTRLAALSIEAREADAATVVNEVDALSTSIAWIRVTLIYVCNNKKHPLHGSGGHKFMSVTTQSIRYMDLVGTNLCL